MLCRHLAIWSAHEGLAKPQTDRQMPQAQPASHIGRAKEPISKQHRAARDQDNSIHLVSRR